MPDPVTFVNVITVDPAKQDEVIELLVDGTEKAISTRPGFVCATLLASLDKRRVITIARWESPEDVKATQNDPVAAEYAKRTAALAQPDPGLYAVVGEFTA